MLPWIIAGAVGLVGAALLGSDDDDRVEKRSSYDDIERRRKEEVARNNQAVNLELQNYQNSEIARIQSKYNVQVYSQDGGFGFENVVLKNLELEAKELKSEIKRLRGLKNALE